MDFLIREVTKDDLPNVLALIKELAVYEKEPQEVTITLDELEKDGFGEHPLYWILVAESDEGVIGISFYYIRYSTWKGKCIYLEDIVVKEGYRRNGVGKALFERTIAEAKNMNAKLMTWQVLDWNQPALDFYKNFDAEMDVEWINGKLRF